MAYLNNIPQSSDSLSTSQGQLLANFAALETQFTVDHASLLVGAATGYHRKLTLPEYAAGADPAALASGGIVYTKDSGTRPELYYRNEGGTIVQMTNGSYLQSFVKAFVSFSTAGVIAGTAYNVGSVTHAGAGTYTINLTAALADANYVVIANPNVAAGSVRAWTIQTTAKAAGSFTVIAANTGTAQDTSCDIVVLRIA